MKLGSLRGTVFATCLTLIGLFWVRESEAQDHEEQPSGRGGEAWALVESLGQPSRWRGLLGIGFAREGRAIGAAIGAGASLGIFRDFFPRHYGAASLGAEGYVGERGDALDAGVRLLLRSEAVFLHGGLDHSVNHRRTDALLGVSFPVQRGGWPLPGAMLRVDWVPARGHHVAFGGTVPLGQPLVGRTRPPGVAVDLPPTSRGGHLDPLTGPAAKALADVRRASRWLFTLHNFFWLSEPTRIRPEAAEAEVRGTLQTFRSSLAAPNPARVQPPAYQEEIEQYHRTLERAFGLAIGAGEHEAVAVGRPLADRARRIALEEVLLPYNRSIGQHKQPHVLSTLIARARARFAAWVQTQPEEWRGQKDRAVTVAAAWLEDLEVLRAHTPLLPADSRMHWLPLAFALRPDEHRTQEQIDSIVALALGRGFERGNAVLHVNAPQFQVELLRTIHETESYHVLWVHDYAGRNPAGVIDGTAFLHTTQGYLRALLDAVRAYDRTGRMPTYLILLDLHNYELRDSRIWMDILERPLEGRLGPLRGDSAMVRAVAALQDSLGQAVSRSSRLQAEARALGPHWISGRVKVHVNITNPHDLSFRAPSLLPPVGADNLMRDHRKIVIRDLSEASPLAGEVILTGAGVGDHYASPTWDDRALVLQGPAALEALQAARATLHRHGLGGDRLPPPLRPSAPARDAAAQIAAAEAAGADARVLQVHNRTGFGQKDATFVQSLLYELAPAGTLIYVPNGLWTSPYWMAQLVFASLRGCHVYIVAPAGTNAPAYSFPQMSRMQELLTRLLLTRELFEDLIEAAGGDLRVGLYVREAGYDDASALLAEIEDRYRAEPFLWEIFPFTPDVQLALREGRERFRPEAAPALPEPLPRPPQMHHKVQLIASVDLLRVLSADTAVVGVLTELLSDPARAMIHPTETGTLIHQQRVEAPLRLPRRMELLEQKGVIEDPVLYFLTGSMNLNVRSMALDGEATAVVSGAWSLQAYLDFAMFSGSVSWIDELTELDSVLPPYSPLQRRIARWIQYVL